jgi:hypothetical protein
MKRIKFIIASLLLALFDPYAHCLHYYITYAIIYLYLLFSRFQLISGLSSLNFYFLYHVVPSANPSVVSEFCGLLEHDELTHT